MRALLLLIFCTLSSILYCQSDSIYAYYSDSTPKAKLFADGHRENYYKDGKLKEWTASDRETTLKNQSAYCIEYYESGNVKTEYFDLPNKYIALVGYHDSANKSISAGRMHHNQSTFKYDGNRLVAIHSETKKIPVEVPYMPTDDPNKPSGGIEYVYEQDIAPSLPGAMKNTVRGSCVAEGNFKHFELYNGFIYYYNEQGERELTEKVVNGVIQYNPKVNFEEKELEGIVTQYFDRNFNGYAEQREVSKVTRFKLRLLEKELETFLWSEIFFFENLDGLVVNDYLYKMSDYADANALKNAIVRHQGAFIGQTTPSPVPPPPPRPEIRTRNEFVAFPDSSAKFIGGENELKKWISKNLVYPEISKNMGNQGKVYIEFIVMQDGSLRDIKILRGVDKFIDQEAKRLIRSMPKWEPAMYKGEKVNSKVRFPIQFILND